MGLFKEIYCKHCGKKTNLLTRKKLKDNCYVCTACATGIPHYIHLSDYTYEDFLTLRSYLTESDTVLSKTFREYHCFSRIGLDTEHGLFYVEELSKRLYLKLENLAEFNLEFIPDQVKEGLLSTKVTGKLFLKMKMIQPYFYKEEILEVGVKAPAEIKGIFTEKAVYSNPKGMDDFLNFFNSAWQTALDQKYARLTAEIEQRMQEMQPRSE